VARIRFAAVCLAALAVTAGCSGVLPATGEPTPSTPTRSPYDVPETPTPTETTVTTVPARTTATTSPTLTGTGPLASLGFRQSVANHSEALRVAGSFVVRERLRRSYRSDRGDGLDRVVSLNRTLAADLDADRYLTGVSPAPGDAAYDSGVTYQTGDSVYHRIVGSNDSGSYRRVFNPRRPTPKEWANSRVYQVPNATLQFPFEHRGTTVFAGEEMIRYVATDSGRIGCLGPGGIAPSELSNVTRFRATALVDVRGTVRRFECVLSGYLSANVRYTEWTTWTMTEVGTASVRPPEGVAGANATNSTDGHDGFRRIEPSDRVPRPGEGVREYLCPYTPGRDPLSQFDGTKASRTAYLGSRL
jgi:hypothetical protein